jgi:hypothetical protein
MREIALQTPARSDAVTFPPPARYPFFLQYRPQQPLGYAMIDRGRLTTGAKS